MMGVGLTLLLIVFIYKAAMVAFDMVDRYDNYYEGWEKDND